MKSLKGLEVNDQIFKTIEDAMFLEPVPYQFSIYGVNCYGGAYQNATVRFERIKKWAEKLGAEVKMINRPVGHKIIFEITDPVAAYLEKHLEAIR